jgi:OOP family OmpA-OmpF porin
MISRFNKSMIVAALVVAGITAAQAQGFYVGGNLGSPHYRDAIHGVGGNGGGVAGKLYGGRQFTPHFAVEGGLFDLGHIDDGSGKIDLRGAYVDAVGSYEFAPKWSLLGSAGVAHGRFSGSAGKDWSPALKLGAGLQYDLTTRVAVRAQYEYFHFTGAFDSNANVGEVSLGVKVAF